MYNNLSPAMKKCCLLKSSAGCKCLHQKIIIGIQTNSVDPNQTTPRGAV